MVLPILWTVILHFLYDHTFLNAGETLFKASVEDNASRSEMRQLVDWSDKTKKEKLSIVANKHARNLISCDGYCDGFVVGAPLGVLLGCIDGQLDGKTLGS